MGHIYHYIRNNEGVGLQHLLVDLEWTTADFRWAIKLDLLHLIRNGYIHVLGTKCCLYTNNNYPQELTSWQKFLRIMNFIFV